MIRILSFLFYAEVQQHNLGWFFFEEVEVLEEGVQEQVEAGVEEMEEIEVNGRAKALYISY